MAAKDFSFAKQKKEADIKEKQAIVAVENEADTEIIESCLKPIRYRVLGKTVDGREALELARKHKTGLFFLDYDIATLGSMAVLEKIKANSAKIKVIVLANKLEKEQVSDAKKRGVVGFLAKPLNEDAVKKVISKLL